jgi:hypothetical protein
MKTMTMSENVAVLEPQPHEGVLVPGRFKIIGIAFVAALLVLMVQWPQRTSDARATETPLVSAADTPTPPIEYEPARYRNSAQNTAPEEHIQAF